MTPLAIIVLVVLVDLLGFTLVMPLLAPFGDQYGFKDWQIGFLFAAYPVCQLVAGPILGRLSDRFGRKPVLIFSQAGTAISFLILGLSRDFRVMLLARMLDGASGVSWLRESLRGRRYRARASLGMGLIGMAFGVGFVLGPLLGGVLVGLPLPREWQLRLPFLVAAAFSTLAWLLVLFRLPESRPGRSAHREAARTLSWRGITDTVHLPGVGLLVSIGFLSVLAFAAFEGTFALYLGRRLRWDAQRAAYAFAGLGFLSAIVQGGLIRRLVPRFGEPRLILVGLILAACGFVALALTTSVTWLLGALALLGVGQGMLSPSVSGLLSRMTPNDEQGAVFGTLTSAHTLARLIGYGLASFLAWGLARAAPYWASFGVDLAALAVFAVCGAQFPSIKELGRSRSR